MFKLTQPRVVKRARSEKPSTVANRERQVQQKGILRGTTLLKKRWTTRRQRCTAWLTSHHDFTKMKELCADNCDKYKKLMKDKMDALEKDEVRRFTEAYLQQRREAQRMRWMTAYY